jgi:hypothetical protein
VKIATGVADTEAGDAAHTAGEDAVRQTLIDDAARREGDVWAASRRDALVDAGRTLADGWPGTISEARVRVAGAIGRELAERAMRALSYEELDQAARLAFRTARGAWLHMIRLQEAELAAAWRDLVARARSAPSPARR